MLKRTLAAVLVVGLGTWFASSCGSSVKPVTPTGTVYSFISDLPFCNVANFHADVTGLTLIGPNGSPTQPVFPAGTRSPLYKVNFGELRDFRTLLDISSVPVGTYVQAKVTFSIGEIAMVDFTQSPPISVLNASFTTTAPVVDLSPPLVVTKGTVSALNIDFNMANSLVVDTQGNITGGVRPSVAVSSVTGSAAGGFGEMDDVIGFVTSVTTTAPAGSSFAGGFSLQTLMGSGPLVTVDFVNSTQICGLTAPPDPPCAPVVSPGCSINGSTISCPSGVKQYIYLNQLLTGSLVEMDGYVDTNGNLVANTVEIEDREVVESNKVGLIGNIVSVTRDQNGNATQFTLYVGDLEPDLETQASQDSVVMVNVDAATVYQCTTCGLDPSLWPGYPPYLSLNFAGLPFNATALAPGQEVIVHGVAKKPQASSLPTTVSSDPTNDLLLKVFLKSQSHQGNFTSLVAAQSDDRTGAFWLASYSVLFQGAPILVATSAQTTFVNATGLTALNTQSTLLVKGLLFYERKGTTVNGVTVPPGTLVMLAKQVHAL